MSLRVKMLCSIGFIIFLVLGTSTLIHIRNVQQDFRDMVELRSDMLAQSIIREVNKRMQFYTLESLDIEALLRGLTLQCMELYELNRQKNITHVAVIAASGIIAAHNEKTMWGMPVESPVMKEQLAYRTQKTILVGTVYDTFIPIFFDQEAYLGSINIGISGKEIDEKIQETLMQSGTLFLIFLVISFIAVSFFVHAFVTKPLRRLTTLGKWITHGEFDRISQLSNRPAMSWKKLPRDEIQELTHAFHDIIAYFQQIVAIATCIADGELSHSIKARSEHDVLGIAFQRMIAYLGEMAETASLMSYGVIQQDIQPKSDQDVLGQAFSQMIVYIREVAYLAEKISAGNLHIAVTPRSDQDMLNHSLQKMILYLQNVGRIVEQIAQNNLSIEVFPQSDQDMLNTSLHRMIENLRDTQHQIEQSMTEIERQNWIKTGQAELSDIIRREPESVVLAKAIITYLATYLHAQVGALYLAHEEEGISYLKLTASYAYTRRDATRDRFKFGEGLVGQVAMERESQIYFNLSKNPILINSDEGGIIPATALLAPIIYENHVQGVIELGSTGEFTGTDLGFLNIVLENIALAFHDLA